MHCTSEMKILIIKLQNEGKPYKFIAETLGCSQNMVKNALKYKSHIETRG
jgi:DNA-directed RNA polymerase specialized sigma24 family protein